MPNMLKGVQGFPQPFPELPLLFHNSPLYDLETPRA
jgi:hypothetical protein